MENLEQHISRLNLDHCREHIAALIQSLKTRLDMDYGNEQKWRGLYGQLPDIKPSVIDVSDGVIRIGCALGTDIRAIDTLYNALIEMGPWRKGPFFVFGIQLESEWASNIKWNRLKDRISPLKGKRILDIGCSSGYYMFKMLDYEPDMVLGIDPQIVFYYQFKSLQKYICSDRLYYLPIGLEDMPPVGRYFDTVFYMGVIYHRKSPVDSLVEIRQCMKPGGELILETLIIESGEPIALFPEDRYAKMRNVFFIPSVPCLTAWLKRARFTDITCIDISKTTLKEQRKTPWIKTESLEDFLDPDDPSKTVEGYPAPVRAIITAKAVD